MRRSCSACAARSSKVGRSSPTEVLEGLDAVTVEDVERVAAEILGGELRLALIGPFDEPERFERLSSAYPWVPDSAVLRGCLTHNAINVT